MSILIVGLLLMSSTVATAQSVDALDDLVARGRDAQRSIRTLSAAFVETTVSSLLRDPLVERGTLVAALPIRVVMTYGSPVTKTIALDDRRFVIEAPAQGLRQEFNITSAQRRIQKYFVDTSAKDLREMFTITLSSEATIDNAYRLDMVPKRAQISEELKRLRIWVDRVRLVMVKMTLEYANGDSKTLELRDIRTNVAIDPVGFALLDRRR
jgi:outer membrane lipoprotein-sorting protein